MKIKTIALATAIAISGTAAFAQTGTAAGAAGYGSVVAPSVGSYVWPSVGSTLAVPTWTNTGPAAAPPRVPHVENPFGSTFAQGIRR